MYVNIWATCVSLYTCMSAEPKARSGPGMLKLDLQVIVSCFLGTGIKPGSSARMAGS